MKTPFDFPFPTSWNADDLADAVPRPLSALFDVDLSAGAAGLTRAARSSPRPRRAPLRSNLPTRFQIR